MIFDEVILDDIDEEMNKEYLEELRLGDPKTLEKDVELRVLNLGAGVQSSVLLMKMLDYEIKRPDVAIFADTGNEPNEVYDWLNKLIKLCKNEIDIQIVKNVDNTGNLVQDIQSPSGRHSLIPVHIKGQDGTNGIGRRTCTYEYKIRPVTERIRNILNVNNLRGKCVEQVFGISFDEIQRAKRPANKWAIHCYPLVENRITRDDCKHYFKHKDIGTPPRSACIMCPYHDNQEWKHLKKNYPNEFKKAIEFDEWLRNGKTDSPYKEKFYKLGKNSKMFIYKGRIPLKEATFEEPSDYQGTLFDDECEGMCGV